MSKLNYYQELYIIIELISSIYIGVVSSCNILN
jgi:hypothetical protein